METIEPLLRAAIAILFVIGLTRAQGLRSFSKMSSFDFALTLAVGSILASTILSVERSLLPGLVAIASIFLLQWLIAWARVRLPWVEAIADNEPLLLMRGAEFLPENMRRARVTRDDLMNKLREANVLSLGDVHAVVYETTGNISVLHSSDPQRRIDPLLLSNVRGRQEAGAPAGPKEAERQSGT